MSRRKRTPWRKRCDCRDQSSCAHPWWLRVRVKGGPRERWNLTERFPDDRVEVAAVKARQDARKGVPAPTARRLTVRDIATKYRAARSSKNDVYLNHFTASLAVSGATIGDLAIDDVTTADVKAARDAWAARPRQKNARRGTDAVRHFLQTARHFFNWSVKEGYATRTPFLSPQGNALITVPQSGSRSRRLEDGEEDRIRAVGDAFFNDFLTAMLSTGCRPGELRTLQWRDVRDRIVIRAEKAKDREERRIPILPELRAILDRRRLGPDGQPLADNTYVFGDDTGRVIGCGRLCARWRTVCAAAKVENLHLHDLRGEFGSRLLESGVAVHHVRDALGHANISMTSTYLRSRTDSLDDAYAQLQDHRLKLVKRA